MEQHDRSHPCRMCGYINFLSGCETDLESWSDWQGRGITHSLPTVFDAEDDYKWLASSSLELVAVCLGLARKETISGKTDEVDDIGSDSCAHTQVN